MASRYVLPLTADTLLASGIRRSTDGGQTWANVSPYGDVLYEAASGVLLAGTQSAYGAVYSHDRGATWTIGVFDGGTGSFRPDGEAFAEVPPGHPRAGRLLGAFHGGLAYSDDGGVTWEKSSLWENSGRYYATSVAAGVDGRVYGAFYESGVEGLQIAASADGGETYGAPYAFGVYRGVGARVVAVPGGADPAVGVVFAVEDDGSVHRSDDGGATWGEVGSVPFGSASSHHKDTVLGPDGRLYVSATQSGIEREWVFRTVEPVVSAAVETEAQPVGGPITIGAGGGSFQFQVRLTNQTTLPMTVEGWSAVTGPVSREPVAGPLALTLQPGQSLVRTVRQQVPAQAPAGTYTYTVKAGDFGGAVLSAASFPFEKAAGAAPMAGRAEAWTVSGWEEAPAAVAADLQIDVSPNPSRGAAAVTLTLGAPTAAEVSVYDVLGRRMAVLHEGPLDAGRHAFTLAAPLPPGVYVVRAVSGGASATQRVTLTR